MFQLVKVPGKRSAAKPRHRETSWWLLGGMFVVVMIALVSTPSMPAWAAFLTLAGVFAMLSLAGLLWGADSRDGSDWKPRKPGALR